MALHNADQHLNSVSHIPLQDPTESPVNGLVYTDRHIADLLEIILPKKRIKKPSPPDRGLIIWDPGFSLQHLEKLPKVQEIMWIYDRVREDLFATTTRTPGYRQVCIPAPNTEDLWFNDQMEIVRRFQEDACATTIAALAWITHKLTTGQSLNDDIRIRCSEKEQGTNRHTEMESYGGSELMIAYGFDDADNIEGHALASIKV